MGLAEEIFHRTEVGSWLEIGSAIYLLTGGTTRLQAQAHATFIGVDLDHPRINLGPDFQDVLDLVDSIIADLRDVNQAIDVVLKRDECAKARDLGHSALDHLVELKVLFDIGPWIRSQLLDPERNATLICVHVQHDSLDPLRPS